jgi:selenocysteine lyase/cysteine desulfurase
MAHAKGVEVCVDGAHAVAHFKFNIPDLNCDYYGASLHKWLSTPLGAGLLYVKKEKIVESAVTGKAVKALCGKKWIPSRDPEKYPICPTCKEIHAGLRPAPEDK